MRRFHHDRHFAETRLMIYSQSAHINNSDNKPKPRKNNQQDQQHPETVSLDSMSECMHIHTYTHTYICGYITYIKTYVCTCSI